MKFSLLLVFLLLFFVSCRQDTKECAELKELYCYVVEDSVTLKLHDMQYACGEDCRFYNVDSVLYSKNKEPLNYYNKEIQIRYLNKEPTKPTNVENCPTWCIVHIYTGYIARNGFGAIRLNVLEGEIFTDPECCEKANY